MKIINKMRDLNIYVKVLIFLILLPLIVYLSVIILASTAFFFVWVVSGNGKMLEEVYSPAVAWGFILGVVIWWRFGKKLFG